jgi:nucleotide-binding universal stress UspA family protein
MTLGERVDLRGLRRTDIVVGVDGSESSRAALRWAVGQGRRTGGRVQAITAWEYPSVFVIGPVLPFGDLASATARLLGESVRDATGLGSPDIEVLEHVVEGHPAQVLVDASAQVGLLVVGSRGRSSFAGAVLGSVSQQCVSHAGCPVVVVRGEDGFDLTGAAREEPGRPR